METDGDGDIRDGRGKVYKQDGSNVAYTLRLRYTGIPGVEFGLWHNHQTDINNDPHKVMYQLICGELTLICHLLRGLDLNL